MFCVILLLTFNNFIVLIPLIQTLRGNEVNQKILKTSAAFSLLFKCLIPLYPAYVIAAWCNWLPSGPNFNFSWGFISDMDLNDVSMQLRYYACGINTLHMIIVVAGFYYLYKLFQLYAQGIIFSKQNIQYMQSIGYAFLLQTIVWILEQPLISFILTSDNAPGQREVSIGFDSHALSNLMLGSIVIVISWVMNEAKRFEDELALTV